MAVEHSGHKHTGHGQHHHGQGHDHGHAHRHGHGHGHHDGHGDGEADGLDTVKHPQSLHLREFGPKTFEENAKAEAAEGLVRTHFRAWDLNGDGRISEEELRPILIACGLPQRDVHKIFVAADMNGDGVLDYDEFIDWIFHGPSKVNIKELNVNVSQPSESADTTNEAQSAENSAETKVTVTKDYSDEVVAANHVPDKHKEKRSVAVAQPEFPVVVMSNISRRFPCVDEEHILMALREAGGHGGDAVGFLKMWGAEGKIVLGEGCSPQQANLLRRYPGATYEMVNMALAEAKNHGGLAASIIDEKLRVQLESAAPAPPNEASHKQ